MRVKALCIFAMGSKIVRPSDEPFEVDDATGRGLVSAGRVEEILPPAPPPPPPDPGPPILVIAKTPIVVEGRLRPAGSRVVLKEHDAWFQLASGTVEAVGGLPEPSGAPDPMVKIHVLTAHWLGGQQGVWAEADSVHECHRVTAQSSVAAGSARILD